MVYFVSQTNVERSHGPDSFPRSKSQGHEQYSSALQKQYRIKYTHHLKQTKFITNFRDCLESSNMLFRQRNYRAFFVIPLKHNQKNLSWCTQSIISVFDLVCQFVGAKCSEKQISLLLFWAEKWGPFPWLSSLTMATSSWWWLQRGWCWTGWPCKWWKPGRSLMYR